MNTRYIPTIRNIINSIVIAINEHPLIKNPPVYYPIPDDRGEFEQIKVARYRTFDGMELTEPGLTVSVFPNFTSDLIPSGYSGQRTKPITFKPEFLGNKGLGFSYETNFKIIVAAHYQDTALGQSKLVNYAVGKDYEVIGHDVFSKLEARRLAGSGSVTNSLEVEINPGEEIIREYMFLLKYVLDDNHKILPWSISSSQVEAIDFPTTSWKDKSENIYFHYGYLVWTVSLYLPGSLTSYFAPETPVKCLSVTELLTYRITHSLLPPSQAESVYANSYMLGDDCQGGTHPTKGSQGDQGMMGFQGHQGVQGDQGFQGHQGFQGNQGFQGHQGVQGDQGFQGHQGFQGNQGFQGHQGVQGDQGFQGHQGFQGNQGFQGHQGVQGDQGLDKKSVEGVKIISANNYTIQQADWHKWIYCTAPSTVVTLTDQCVPLFECVLDCGESFVQINSSTRILSYISDLNNIPDVVRVMYLLYFGEIEIDGITAPTWRITS